MKVHEILEMNANKYPNKLGIIFDEVEKTFSEINSEANSVANAFLEMGIRPKDKIATLFYNEPDLIISYFALLKIGVQVVPINFRLAPPEMAFMLCHSEAKGIIYDRSFSETIDAIKPNLGKDMHYIVAGGGGEEGLRLEDLKKAGDRNPGIKVKGDDLSFLMYTSGTTGRPKGVMITYDNTLWNAFGLAMTSELRHRDVVLNPMPLFHAGALNRYWSFLLLGCTYISMKNFDAVKSLEMIQKYGVTYMLMVPAMAQMIFQVKDLPAYDLSSVRECLITAAIVPVSVKKKVTEVFPNAGLVDGYGLTEATSCATAIKPEDAFRKLTSVGLPYHFNEAMIVDDHGKEIPAGGGVGEIVVRGPNVMKGYYKDPKATKEAIVDGWLHTGDLGRRDEEGYFYIVDRKKDMLISGGENIYPAEVEATLNSHLKILESAVIGAKDEKWGETVLALVVLHPGESMTTEEVDRYCREKMAKYKRPRVIKFVENLPRNAAGKVMKTELRQTYGNAVSYR